MTANDKLKSIIGDLIIQIAVMSARIDELQTKPEVAKPKEVKEVKNA